MEEPAELECVERRSRRLYEIGVCEGGGFYDGM